MKPDDVRRVFEGKTLSVVVERWGEAEREIVERVEAVAVVAVDDEGRVVLVRQMREAVRRVLLELPAGKVDGGEDPSATARRELAEETGLRADLWRNGPVFWATPGFCTERVHLFAAEELVEGDATPEAGEHIEVVRLPVAEAIAGVDKLEDAKTIAGLLWYATLAPA